MAKRKSNDWVIIGGLVLIPSLAFWYAAKAGLFKPKMKGVPDQGPTGAAGPSGAVDPAGFLGTQTASSNPLGETVTPGAGLGHNPPPVQSPGVSLGPEFVPEPYTPGNPYYEETWYREQDYLTRIGGDRVKTPYTGLPGGEEARLL